MRNILIHVVNCKSQITKTKIKSTTDSNWNRGHNNIIYNLFVFILCVNRINGKYIASRCNWHIFDVLLTMPFNKTNQNLLFVYRICSLIHIPLPNRQLRQIVKINRKNQNANRRKEELSLNAGNHMKYENDFRKAYDLSHRSVWRCERWIYWTLKSNTDSIWYIAHVMLSICRWNVPPS